jgi:HEAT repeat protein
MRFVQFVGLLIGFSSVGLLLAGGVGVPKKEDVPKYMKQLTAASGADRAKAAEMLGKRGGINANDVEDAVEPLKTMLQKDRDTKARAAAARALGDIHPEASTTVPTLIEALKNDKEKEVKMAAVVALGQFGSDAKDALPPLREYATKFDLKKSKDGQTIQAAIQLINGAKKKKN